MGTMYNGSSLFACYEGALQFRDRVYGGTPGDPQKMRGWILKNTGVTDNSDDLRRLMQQTLLSVGVEVGDEATMEEMEAAADAAGLQRNTNVFRRDEVGVPYLEARTFKAMLKECINILFAGQRWGAGGKGPKSYVAERVIVRPDRLVLRADAPVKVQLFVGHPSGPRGVQANLTNYEYLERATVEFEVLAMADCLSRPQWDFVWELAQENGWGSLRSQEQGKFDILRFERVHNPGPVPDFSTARKAKGTKAEAEGVPA